MGESGTNDSEDSFKNLATEEKRCKVSDSGTETAVAVVSKDDDKKPGATDPTKAVEREGHCYCGKDRNLNIVELLCASCMRWFHESCIGYQLGKLVPFMVNYYFVCKNCSPTGLESFKKNQAAFPQMCITAIGNLQQASVKDGTCRTTFSKDKDIIPFIEAHWEGMTTMPRRVTQSWHTTIQRALTKDVGSLFTCEESSDDGNDLLYGLLGLELTNIKPNYEAMIRGGHLKITDSGIQPGLLYGWSEDYGMDISAVKWITFIICCSSPTPGHSYGVQTEFDESSDWAGKPIPGWLYRVVSPSTVLLALHDRAPQLHISEDRLAVTGEKGYCMVRATHSVTAGIWYYEATIEDMPEGSATRIGWGQNYANLQAPLGYDKFGYSWRSRKGTRFHDSRGKHYSLAYEEGDVLGFLIILPESEVGNYIPPTYKDKPLVKFKNHLYYEDKDRVTECLKSLKPVKGSKIVFFKNGVNQGPAFIDIYGGAYYPSVSLHKNATVSFNFGPNFKYPPKDYMYRPMSEKAKEALAEQTIADLMYLTENEGRLRLDVYSTL
ncbi:set1/Ash2 histone methyltransferase complex subunit ASH2 isoform X2 [Schistocerca cancellata]|uniref:set1/Ash2 histone methyltransferase complex subunit ASH2 isoform X2 n=1 Tax=Schistocerca cancellata TaxID=274614 RepID=UPI0021195B6D|nr:set1/Ash2 histone methyltransferase complex subunit ASH2 isoform X2 [Schistocerca cancellata]